MATSILKHGVGIDVSKKELSVCFSNLEQGQKARVLSTRTFPNNGDGLKKMDAWMRSLQKDPSVPLTALMEATGVYYEEAAYFLKSQGWGVCVLLPNATKAFGKSLNVKSKTDAIDARVLAQLALEREHQQWEPLAPKMLRVKRLCRERVALQDHKTAALNQLEAMRSAHEADRDSIVRANALVKFLKDQVREVEKAIKEEVAADEVLKGKVEKICTVQGIGLITAATVISETNGFALFTSKAQLVSYAGYDVVENQSGSSIKGKTRISKKGNSKLRRALHFPALVTVKHVPEMRALYQRVFEATRIKLKGYVAVQRKLLVLIYTLYKKDLVYDPVSYQKTKAQLEPKK